MLALFIPVLLLKCIDYIGILECYPPSIWTFQGFFNNLILNGVYPLFPWIVFPLIGTIIGGYMLHAIKTKNPGFFFKRLPSLELLDSTGYACIIAGFTMVTFGLITGFVYAKSVWGRFWSWDPKEVWSGITWLFYAALLHERLTVGWRGRRAAIMAIIGFAVVLFTFFGVNFLLKGHHEVFTTF